MHHTHSTPHTHAHTHTHAHHAPTHSDNNPLLTSTPSTPPHWHLKLLAAAIKDEMSKTQPGLTSHKQHTPMPAAHTCPYVHTTLYTHIHIYIHIHIYTQTYAYPCGMTDCINFIQAISSSCPYCLLHREARNNRVMSNSQRVPGSTGNVCTHQTHTHTGLSG